jgi:hypothetical protein
MQRNAIQPDDVFILVCQLGVIFVVVRNRMRQQVPVRSRPRMVGVSLMDMLRRQRRESNVRRQDEAESNPAEGLCHGQMIMVAG